jgi:ketosteroid isomerase-like protein
LNLKEINVAIRPKWILMNALPRKIAFASLLLMVITGCRQSVDHDSMVRELINVDKEYARQSVEKGSHTAFLGFIDDSCVLLRPRKMPVIGKQRIIDMFSSPDTSFTLNWEPSFADVAVSGELGYTYGIFTVEMDSPEGELVTKKGTYCTVWKKDKNGEWKFVLDTGNQGVGPKKEEDK